MARESGGKSQRVFFAVWPDIAARRILADLASEVAHESGGRPTPAGLLHLTLAFLGNQPSERIEALQRLAGAIQACAFMLALDEVGGFRRTGIAWVGASAPQPELAALHKELVAALRSQQFLVDERPYAPHLTLARRSVKAVDRRLPQPICWRVASFALVASEPGRDGPAYRSIATWPLSAG